MRSRDATCRARPRDEPDDVVARALGLRQHRATHAKEDVMRRSQRLTRRRFLGLVASGALAAATPAAAAVPPPRKVARPTPAHSPAIERGIAEQKSVLALQLKTLRDYSLPPGSDPAFVFRPLRARRLR